MDAEDRVKDPDRRSTLGYVVLDSFYTKSQMEDLLIAIEENIVCEEPPDNKAEYATKTSNVNIVPVYSVWNIIRDFIYNLQFVNREYFGYDIYNDFHLDTFNYNVYEEGGEYDWHIDGGNYYGKYDIKLSASINLSLDKYEGGDFNLMLESDEKGNIKKFNTTPGSMIVFNPYKMHKVEPVTKGVRRSISYWAPGPKWR